MQERVKRGVSFPSSAKVWSRLTCFYLQLVTEEEKVKFAEEEAERSKETKERKDCVVM